MTYLLCKHLKKEKIKIIYVIEYVNLYFMISSLASTLERAILPLRNGPVLNCICPYSLINFSSFFFLKNLTLYGVFMKVNIGGRQRLHLFNFCEILQ